AEEAPPDPPSGPRFPGAQEIADAVLHGLSGVLTSTLDTWWDQSGPVVFGRLLAVAFGALVAWVWAAVGPVLSAVDFFTRIPPQWSYQLAPLVQLRDRLTPLGGAVVLLGLVLGIG
ncbi:hypothetical protein DN554_30445, partial [Burkholderia multivorans]|uniref:hypothetical protein n=1 Tax=Burkholderia multivorans TaxID=87883 RepID=UPI000DB0CF62